MVAWNDYKSEAKARGALALELFVVESTPVKGLEALKEALPAHLAYQRRLEESGQLVLAGPLSDASGNEMQGTGMIIYRADSLEAATALTEADPMHARGSRTFKIRKWLINEGSLSLNVGLSTGKVVLT